MALRERTATGTRSRSGFHGATPAEPEASPLSVNELILTYIDWAENYYRGPDGTANKFELCHVKRAVRPCFNYSPDAGRETRTEQAGGGPRSAGRGGVQPRGSSPLRATDQNVFKLGVVKEMIPAAVWQGSRRLTVCGMVTRLAMRRSHPPVDDADVDRAQRPQVLPSDMGDDPVWSAFSGCPEPAESVLNRGSNLDPLRAVVELHASAP